MIPYKTVKVYLHRPKEDNFELIKKLNLKGEAEDNLSRMGYEVELLYRVDTHTGKSELIGADGTMLSNTKYVHSDLIG